MTTDVHTRPEPSDQSAALLDTTRAVAPRWLERATLAAAARSGVEIGSDDPEVVRTIEAAVARLVDDLADLLAVDVDEQRSNPLSLFRQAVAGPTALLLRRGAQPPPVDRFSAERFPDDVFGIGPATWADVDPALHEPGIAWGAWKAITVLRRRRDEGLR